jgi:hypothetical protein
MRRDGIFGMREVFLRDRAAFLVGVSKHGSKDGRQGKIHCSRRSNKTKPMDGTANFSLRFARVSDSKTETPDSFPSRQVLQRVATRLSLVSHAIGFSILGILIITNRHQAELNGLAGGSAVAMIGGVSAFLVSTVFLFATYLHWRHRKIPSTGRIQIRL